MAKHSIITASAVYINASSVQISGIVDVTGRTAAASVVPPTAAPSAKPVSRRSLHGRGSSDSSSDSSSSSMHMDSNGHGSRRLTPATTLSPAQSLTPRPAPNPSPNPNPNPNPNPKTLGPTATNKDIINTRTVKPSAAPVATVPGLGLGTPMEASWGGAYGGSGGRLAKSGGATIEIIVSPPTMQPTAYSPPPSAAASAAATALPTAGESTPARPSARPSFFPSFVLSAAPTLETDPVCSPFVNVDSPVGGVSLQAEILTLADNDYTTATGSDGGGGVGAGKGGGRIAIFALSINLTFAAQLLADGSSPHLPTSIPLYPSSAPTANPSAAVTNATNSSLNSAPPSAYPTHTPLPTSGTPSLSPTFQLLPVPVTIRVPNKGAGSGGAIALTARTFSGNGWISVKGGDSTPIGAAGGGGRISIQILSSQEQLGYQVRLHGGLVKPTVQPTMSPTNFPTPLPSRHANVTRKNATQPSLSGGAVYERGLGAAYERGLGAGDWLGYESMGSTLGQQGWEEPRRLQSDDDSVVQTGVCGGGSGLPCCAAGGAGTIYIQYGPTAGSAGLADMADAETTVAASASATAAAAAAADRRKASRGGRHQSRNLKDPPRDPPAAAPPFPPGVLYISNHGHRTAAATLVDTQKDASVFTPAAPAAGSPSQPSAARDRRKLDPYRSHSSSSGLVGVVVVDKAVVAVGGLLSASAQSSSPGSTVCPSANSGASFNLRHNGIGRGVYSGGSGVGGVLGQRIDLSCSFVDVEDASIVFFLSSKSATAAPTSAPTMAPSVAPTRVPVRTRGRPSPVPTLRAGSLAPTARPSLAVTDAAEQDFVRVQRVEQDSAAANPNPNPNLTLTEQDSTAAPRRRADAPQAPGQSATAARPSSRRLDESAPSSMIFVDLLHMHAGSQLIDSGEASLITLAVPFLYTARGSVINVGHRMAIRTSVAVLNGSLVQPRTAWSLLPTSSITISRSLGLAPGEGAGAGAGTSGRVGGGGGASVTLGNTTITSTLVVEVDTIVLQSTAAVTQAAGLPGSCYSAVPQDAFSCRNGLYSGAPSMLANGTVVLAGRLSVAILAGATVQVPALLLCGGTIEVAAGGAATSDGCGCGPNAGRGAGYAPVMVLGPQSVAAGGSGGAYGGYGGRSGARPPGREHVGGDRYFRTFRQEVPASQSPVQPSSPSSSSGSRGAQGLRDLGTSPRVPPSWAPTRSPLASRVDSRGFTVVHIYYSGSGGGLGGGGVVIPAPGGNASSPSSRSAPAPPSPVAAVAAGMEALSAGLGGLGGSVMSSSGGGMVVVQADDVAIINGLVSSNGAAGGSWSVSLPSPNPNPNPDIGHFLNTGIGAKNSLGNGGGSGGVVVINAASIQGNGTLSATGGAGGTGLTVGGGGGGGGGGVIGLFNPQAIYVDAQQQPLFNFSGILVLAGGARGSSPRGVYALHPSHPTLAPSKAPSRASLVGEPTSARVNETKYWYSSVNASAGSEGMISWPRCLKGYGNVYSAVDGGAIGGGGAQAVFVGTGGLSVTLLCGSCQLGTYSPGGAESVCQACAAIPASAKSFYSKVRQSSPQCVCECAAHFPVLERGASCQAGTTDVCLTAFGYFMFIAFGGVYQFACTVVGIAVFFALVVWRRRLMRMMFEKEERIVFKKVFYGKNIGFDDYNSYHEGGEGPGSLRGGERESISRSSMLITGLGGITGVGHNKSAPDRATRSPLFGYTYGADNSYKRDGGARSRSVSRPDRSASAKLHRLNHPNGTGTYPGHASSRSFVRDSISDTEGGGSSGTPFSNFSSRHRDRESMDVKYKPGPRVVLR